MADSKAAWKKAKVHEGVTLPSGTKVDIKLPNLAQLIKGGQIPNSLLEIATKIGTGTLKVDDEAAASPELIGQVSEFHAFLVEQTVVKPEITRQEVLDEEIPAEDVSVIVQFALRERDTDVVGHHLAGLETVDEFRRFRGLDSGVEGLLGA
jgi:hypothetical protein